MFDFVPNQEPWEDEPSWENFFTLWKEYLSRCADYYGLEIVSNRLHLPKGQNGAMLALAKIEVLTAKEKLHKAYPDHEAIINKLPY